MAIIHIDGIIDENSFEKLKSDVSLTSVNEPIDFLIGSGGGVIDDGIKSANFIQGLESTRLIRTLNLANSDSIATLIFAAPTKKENRIVVDSSSSLFHRPKATIFRENLDENDLLEIADSMNADKKRIVDFLEPKFSGLSRNDIEEMVNSGKTLTGRELSDLGFATLQEQFQIAAINKNKLNYNKMGLFDKQKPKVFPFQSFKTKAGKQIIYNEDLKVGSDVALLDPVEGEVLTGEHELESGDILVVNKENKVESIKEASINEEVKTEFDADAFKSAIMEEVEVKMKASFDLFQENLNKSLTESNKELTESINSKLESMTTLFDKMKNTSSNHKPFSRNNKGEMSTDTKLSVIAEAQKEIRNKTLENQGRLILS